MEQLAVQRERVAVVAKIQPEDGEPGVVEQAADRYDVIRLRAPLPPVQQDGETSRFGGLRAVVAKQAHVGAAVDDLVARRGQQGRRAAPQPALPPRPTGEQRLDVPMLETARGVERLNGVRQTRPRNRLART